MGIYDEVVAGCPACKDGLLIWQSKAGPCRMEIFHANSVPVVIADDIAGDATECTRCERVFEAELAMPDPKVEVTFKEI